MNTNNISPSGNGTPAPQKKRKFNIIDFFILLLIVAIISVTVYAFSPWSQLKKLWSSDEISFQYAVEIRNVDAKYIDLIQQDQAVINATTKNAMGTVSRIDTKVSTELYYTIDEEKNEVQGELLDIPDKFDITVYVTTPAQYEPGVGYTVNGCRVAVGEALDLRFPHFAQTGYCIAIATDS